ncbi:hypothetical protein MUP01_10190 [Candidatus Bathyarchaeota archaeon]|nr:hypothetical protein [Candidatus Bathyarchaeota archaeon]
MDLKLLQELGDWYTRQARVFPALLVVFPIALIIVVWFPGHYQGLGLATGALSWLLLTALVSQFVRDAGKAREGSLFEKWGGTPTTLMLSHSYTSLNSITLADCHSRLRQLRPNLDLPESGEDETKDWSKSNQVYESCSDYLREATRDKERFNLLFDELVSYGFRRNLWSLKPYGATLASLGLLGCAFRVASPMFPKNWNLPEAVSLQTIFGTLICLALLLTWLISVTPNWVKTAAFRYARQLVLSCEKL